MLMLKWNRCNAMPNHLKDGNDNLKKTLVLTSDVEKKKKKNRKSKRDEKRTRETENNNNGRQ